MLELRDGRRVTIPLSLLRSVHSVDERVDGEQEMDHGSDMDPGTDSGFSSEQQGVGSWQEDDVTVVWEDAVPSDVGKELVCWGTKEEPLEVTSLAMAESDGDITGVSTAPNLGDCDKTQPKSKWVLETLTEFGIVLGASFEGYEEELTKILQDIEARRKQKGGMDDIGKKAMKSGGKGSRELKNLVSSINYEGKSAKNKGQRERGRPLYLCS